MVKNYYLFRHGQTHYSKYGLPYGENNLKAEILPESFPILERMGEFLKGIPSEFNASSEFLRCRQTTEIIKRVTNKDFVFDKQLNEFYQTTFKEFSDKLIIFLKQVNDNSVNETLVICSHGAVLAGLKHLILEGQFEEPQLLDYPQTGVIICLEDKKLRELDFNLPVSNR